MKHEAHEGHEGKIFITDSLRALRGLYVQTYQETFY